MDDKNIGITNHKASLTVYGGKARISYVVYLKDKCTADERLTNRGVTYKM